MVASNVSLQPGQQYRVTLGGGGGTGYTWDYTVEGMPDVISVSVETSEAPALPPPGGPPPPTFSIDLIYVITALNVGTAQIRFYFHRPWERDKPPNREFVVDVSVTLD